jgi:vitamin B12/bleomycin/antimicrobial peptide transport system ATP-binding/permease protein
MQRFNLIIFKQFWAIAKSYWSSDEKWRARGMLLLVVLLSLGYTGLSVLLNNKRGALISALSAQDKARFGLLIRGPSGCGKSSLLRAIAGLWNAGTGTILRPILEQMLFLSQRPYMILGTLRDQMLYPKMDGAVEDSQLREILIQVNLPDLEQSHGGFNAEQNWAEVLSLGEQPDYAILDEATSALDSKNEEHLYQQLQDSEMTFLSVGHRESPSNYHQSILDFTANQTWSLKASEALPTRGQ